jgi:hypothetical protein
MENDVLLRLLRLQEFAQRKLQLLILDIRVLYYLREDFAQYKLLILDMQFLHLLQQALG